MLLDDIADATKFLSDSNCSNAASYSPACAKTLARTRLIAATSVLDLKSFSGVSDSKVLTVSISPALNKY